MSESSETIDDYAEEPAIAYGVPFLEVRTALCRMMRLGAGIAPPVTVSKEEYEWLQQLLEEDE